MKRFLKLSAVVLLAGILLIMGLYLLGFLGSAVILKVSGFSEKAQQAKIQTDLKLIIEAAEMQHALRGSYPASVHDFVRDDDQNCIREVTLLDAKDPWGRDYLYAIEADGKPHVRCLGKDGIPGGTGIDQDFEYHRPENEKTGR